MLHPASTFFRRDPIDLMRRLSDDLNRGFSPTRSRGYPLVNLWQGAEAAAVTAELPGVDPDDIEISVKENILTVSGERKAPAGDGVQWHMRERAFGRFSRAVRAPFPVDPDKVEARMENGVLQIVLHRREEDKPRRIEVKSA